MHYFGDEFETELINIDNAAEDMSPMDFVRRRNKQDEKEQQNRIPKRKTGVPNITSNTQENANNTPAGMTGPQNPFL